MYLTFFVSILYHKTLFLSIGCLDVLRLNRERARCAQLTYFFVLTHALIAQIATMVMQIVITVPRVIVISSFLSALKRWRLLITYILYHKFCDLSRGLPKLFSKFFQKAYRNGGPSAYRFCSRPLTVYIITYLYHFVNPIVRRVTSKWFPSCDGKKD